MRKVFVLLLACFGAAAASGAYAQSASFGMKGGLNISSIGGNAGQVASAKAGFHAGIYVHALVSDKVAIQPELVYSQQGYQVTSANSFSNDGFSVNYNYLNLPVMVKMYATDGFNIQLGPQVGYLVNPGELPGVKRVDFGLGLGVGYEFTSGLNFTGRYNLGLSNTGDNSNNLVATSTNRVFQLSIAYTFGTQQQ